MYYVYMLRCADNVIYTGITNNVKRRMEEHAGVRPFGAKFTRSHAPVRVEALWSCADRSLALRLEARIKKLAKKQKERLIAENDMSLIAPLQAQDYSREELSEELTVPQ